MLLAAILLRSMYQIINIFSNTMSSIPLVAIPEYCMSIWSLPWWVIHWGLVTWWRHQMAIFSALRALCARNSPVTGEFLIQRPVTRSFDVFFDLCLNEWLSKQSWGWWFGVPWRPLCRHSNEISYHCNVSWSPGGTRSLIKTIVLL